MLEQEEIIRDGSDTEVSNLPEIKLPKKRGRKRIHPIKEPKYKRKKKIFVETTPEIEDSINEKI